MDNHSIIGRCLQYVKSGLADLIRLHFPGENTDDVATSLRLIAFRWSEIGIDLPPRARTLAHELREVRNEWAHQAEFSEDDTHRALDTAERLLRALRMEILAEEVKKLSNPIGEGPTGEPGRNPRVFRVAKPTSFPPHGRGGCHNKFLRDIPFSDDPAGSSYPCLMERLASITDQVYGRFETKSGPIARQFTPLDFKWVNESRIVPTLHNGVESLQILLHIGDTKEQGRHFFSLNPKGVSWPEKVSGHALIVTPYIKIANAYASALLWILPSEAESSRTHTNRFFEEFSGSVLRDEWDNFDSRMSSYITGWRDKCYVRDGGGRADWNELVTSKNYTKFLVSVGTNLRILIPYAECRSLDTDVRNSPLAAKYKETIEEIKELVERPVKSRLG